jgi:hypothetical protein
MFYKISPNPSLSKRGNGEDPAGLYESPLFIEFSILHIRCFGVSINPTLEKGGKGGFLELINLPKDTPPSLRRGVLSTASGDSYAC